MASQANVNSSEAIESVRAALLRFAKEADDGLTECGLEMRRMLQWLEQDRPAYWRERARRAHDAVQQAQDDLRRCMLYPVGVNDRPACTEQRAALSKAQAHLEHCREKQRRVAHWIREVRHELLAYEGRTAQMREVLDADTPAAAAALGRMLDSLAKYAAAGLPASPPPDPPSRPDPADAAADRQSRPPA